MSAQVMSLQALRPACLAAAVAALCLAPATSEAQQGRVRVEYDVELSVVGSVLDRNCTATGNDILTGTLVGLEPAPRGEPAEYYGTLMRSTRITICGSRTTAAGVDVVCSMTITGGGFPNVVLTVEPGGQGAWLQYMDQIPPAALRLPLPPAGQRYSYVNGTCDPAEMAEVQDQYDTGSTAGSPSGQPLEVPALPPPAIPQTYSPNPPVSIWTLKVLARRP